jgi:hypothetical protein
MNSTMSAYAGYAGRGGPSQSAGGLPATATMALCRTAYRSTRRRTSNACLTVPGVSGFRSPWRDTYRTKAASRASQCAGVMAATVVPPWADLGTDGRRHATSADSSPESANLLQRTIGFDWMPRDVR